VGFALLKEGGSLGSSKTVLGGHRENVAEIMIVIGRLNVDFFERRIIMFRKLVYLCSIVFVLGLVLASVADGAAPLPNAGWW